MTLKRTAWLIAIALNFVVLGLSLHLNYLSIEYVAWLKTAPVYLHKEPSTGNVHIQVPYTKHQYKFSAVCRSESKGF